MNAASNDNSTPLFRGRTPEDFRHRRRDRWHDGDYAPLALNEYVMVRLWDGRRDYYSIGPAEMPAFCEWLEWYHSTTTRSMALAVRGVRIIHVVRLPPFIMNHMPADRHQTPDALPRIISKLFEDCGEIQTRQILRDFF